ncbi:peptidoglycan-recognition protein LE-like [Onthophagus taurus]|uniref:peptidoglycan-recognition protein LE-like n=1 Tax=Onthophagus taurus TaxID=166361 RepID=UPI000C208D69|nr:peptidoglycan-recognition protein LE-like [Onthophagus taurus]
MNVGIKEKLSNLDRDDRAIIKCTEWLQKTLISDDEESICSETTESSNFSKISSEVDDTNGILECYSGNREIFLNDEISHSQLETVITQSQNVYTNVNIKKSKNVHLGNVTYINGPVYINQTSTVVNQHTTINQIVNVQDDEDDSKPPYVINRIYWLAQPPSEPHTYLESPAKYVVICHSATEESFTQPGNILMVRLIQQFHIESRCFGDIGYNFLIGADGNAYEGRGWNIIGAHTYVYNKVSVGICFIGCFTMKLPSAVAMKKAKRLIDYGVRLGYIDKEYSLVGHCQCTTTESPGRTLFEELKTWNRFNGEIYAGMPIGFHQPNKTQKEISNVKNTAI